MVNCLLFENWDMYKHKILKTQFIPFIVYLVAMVNWMIYLLKDDEFVFDLDEIFELEEMSIDEKLQLIQTTKNNMMRQVMI